MSNVPSILWTPTGPQLPQETDIFNGVQADQNTAFGGNLNLGKSTPQGQLAQSLTAIIGDKNSQIANIVNQINPDYADGAFQDAIGRIYFLTRHPATATTVTCTCTGLSGTTIPDGSGPQGAARVQDASGNIYLCQTGGVIPDSGKIELPFVSQNTGPIQCLAGTVTTIYQAIPGWDTVTNQDDGKQGNLVESRGDFEYRRQQSVAFNAHGSLASIYAAVFALPDVTDVYATENVLDVPIYVGTTGYRLAPHSLYVAVVGGEQDQIANAIWQKKDVGCNTNGSTSMTVLDTTYSYPAPSYTISYEAPPDTPVKFAVQLANNGTLPSRELLEPMIQNAIITAFLGQDGGSRARIGSTIFASRFYAGIAALSPTFEILSVLVGLTTATQNAVTMGIDQHPTISASDITVMLV